MKLYRISHWEKLYEVRKPSAVTARWPGWRCRPKLDSFGFRRVAMQRERSDLFSAWVLMLEVAARQPRKWRGALVRDGVPLTAEHLATITGWPAAAFSQAFEFFTDPEQGWLTVENIPDAAASSPELKNRPRLQARNLRCNTLVTPMLHRGQQARLQWAQVRLRMNQRKLLARICRSEFGCRSPRCPKILAGFC